MISDKMPVQNSSQAECQAFSPSHLVELEVILVRSAMAHQYALIGLKEASSYMGQQVAMAQMEQCREAYFQAREQMAQASPLKLVQIEEDLRLQKEIVLRVKNTLH